MLKMLIKMALIWRVFFFFKKKGNLKFIELSVISYPWSIK
jgi:hypothetical protein